MNLIGLAGFSGVGKNEIAKHLGWPTAAFADALKRRVADTLWIETGVRLDPWGRDKEALRDLLVSYAEAARAIQPDIWLRRLEFPRGDKCCITDVRYPNECDYINRMGGMVFMVQREGIGPANDTERDSITGIYSRGNYFTRVVNDDPKRVAGVIAEFAAEHFGKRRAA